MEHKSIIRRKFLSDFYKLGALSVGALPITASCAKGSQTQLQLSKSSFSPGTARDIRSLVIPARLNKFTTSGFAKPNDGGAWEYRRTDKKPAHDLVLRDASGAWFEGSQIDGAIMPGPFGALGNSQNEGVALQKAMQTAIHLGCWLKLAPDTQYVVNPARQGRNGWYAVADTGQSILLDFNGATVKMAGKLPTLGNSFFHCFSVQMRRIRGKRGQRIPLVHIRNARLDGNLRDQLPPDSEYAYEQRALLKIAAADGNRIDRVLIEDAVIIDRIADGILVGPSTKESFDDDGDGRAETAAIKRCDIVHPYCEAAPGANRAFMALGSGCSRYNIVQPQCPVRRPGDDYNAIETEFSSIGQQDVTINISGGTIDALELGMPRNAPDHSRVMLIATNLVVRDYYVQIGGSIRTRNCILPIATSHAQAVQGAEHDGTIFRHSLNEEGDVRPLTLRVDYTPSTTYTERNGCRHELIKPPTKINASRAAIRINPSPRAAANKYVVKLDGSYFSPGFPLSIDNYGGGTVTTRNTRLAGTVSGVRTGSFGKYGGIYKSDNDDWRGVRSRISVDIVGNSNWPKQHVISGGKRTGQKMRLRGKFARGSIKASDQPAS